MEHLTKIEYKLLGVNRALRWPLVLIIRTLVAGWVTTKYVGRGLDLLARGTGYVALLGGRALLVLGRLIGRLFMAGWDLTCALWNAVFNKRNAVRVRRGWRAYCQLISDTGDFAINLMFFRGKVGQVIFDLAEGDMGDGTIVVRQFGVEQVTIELPFRIENRWLVNGKDLPSGYVLSTIRSQALTAGFNVVHLTWGGRKLMPYTVAPLGLLRKPDDVVLPQEEKWTEEQNFPQYAGDPLGRHSNVLQRA